ncbi:MAG: MATE family efflux transporter [Clostridia bacterium]|nr:MATE family efflux transporter [Clostridia bacterium]
MRCAEKEKYLFEESPVLKAILSLALPSVMGQIILVVYNMADTFFVGLTKSDAMITAVTVCMPAFMFLSAISNLFGVGGASVISRMMGSGRREDAGRASAFAIWGCALTSAIYALGAFLFVDVFVDLLGGSDPQVHAYAVQYMKVTVVFGGMVTAMNTLLSHLIRAEGRSMQASLGIMIGGLLNIVLDPLFMFVILKPGQETLGAALATTLSNAGALIYFLIYLWLKRKEMILSAKPERGMLRGKLAKDIICVGIPACLMTLCENISYAILDKLMAAYGTAAQAGIGVAKKVNMMAHCIVRGMAQGVLPLIGYNFASGNRKRMGRILSLSATMSVAISTICMAVALFFSDELIGLFLQGATESRSYGRIFLRIMCIGAPFSAWAYTAISFFQATGHTVKSLVLALLRKGILDIPMMFLLGRLWPIYGIVCATPAADIFCCFTAIVLFAMFMSKHGRDPVPELMDEERAEAALGEQKENSDMAPLTMSNH